MTRSMCEHMCVASSARFSTSICAETDCDCWFALIAGNLVGRKPHRGFKIYNE